MALSIKGLSIPTRCLVKILGYNLDESSTSTLGVVSKCFRTALQMAMQAEWREMGRLWSAPASFAVAHLEERGQALERITKSIVDRLDSWKIERPPDAASRDVRQRYKDRVSEHSSFRSLHRRVVVLLNEEKELFSARFPEIFAKVVERWEKHSELLLRRLSAADEEIDFRVADAQVNQFLKEEGLACRERRVRLIDRLDPESPDQIRRCFTKLYKEQQEITSWMPFWRSAFGKNLYIFCAQCRLDAEECVQKALADADQDLCNMWANIRTTLQWFTVPAVVLPPDAPQVGALASEIRRWMNNSANALFLDKMRYLYLGPGLDPVGGGRWLPVDAIPREITRCCKLSWLDLSEVEELPPFLADLRYLNNIRSRGESTVTCISDRAYRHMESTLPGSYEAIELDESKLKEIPFRKQFKDNWCIPHVSLAKTVLEFDENNRDNVCNSLMFIFLCPLAFLLEIPTQIAIFFYNLFVGDILEPIITFARDLFGYSRMVKVGKEE